MFRNKIINGMLASMSGHDHHLLSRKRLDLLTTTNIEHREALFHHTNVVPQCLVFDS